MNNPTNEEIIKKLEDELEISKTQTNSIIELIEKAIGLCNKAISEMRKKVIDEGFQDLQDEIHFFKQIKPEVSSKLIFYTELFHIETYRPLEDKKILTSYFQDIAQRLNGFLKENGEFYQYFKRGNTFSDHLYFARGNANSRIHVDNIINHLDPDFSTAYGQTLAKIMAYEQLTKYASNEIEKLNNEDFFVSDFQWTGKNIYAAELVYALFSLGVINNGNITIIELTRLFEKIFNIKLDNIYKMFQEIQGRSEQTKFLNRLKEALLKRFDDMNK